MRKAQKTLLRKFAGTSMSNLKIESSINGLSITLVVCRSEKIKEILALENKLAVGFKSSFCYL